jgi:hypothetical protein
MNLHELAIEMMEKINEKYNMNNILSLDEYLYEYYNMLSNDERNEITNLISKF